MAKENNQLLKEILDRLNKVTQPAPQTLPPALKMVHCRATNIEELERLITHPNIVSSFNTYFEQCAIVHRL